MAKLLSSLPIGATVKFGKHSIAGEVAQPIIWVVAAKNHSGYPNNSVTLLSKYIIDLRPFDGSEADTDDAVDGNNSYALSNLNQWLNSDANASAWYSPTHSKDAPPNSSNVTYGTEYYTRPGFLYNFETAEKSALLSTTLAMKDDNISDTTISTKVFIPSPKETGVAAKGAFEVKDGTTILAYFEQFGYGAQVTSQVVTYSKSSMKLETVGYWYYWARNSSIAESAFKISSDGYYVDTPKTGYNGVRPIINLSQDMLVGDVTDADGCYTFAITNTPSAPTNLQITTSPIYTTKPCSIKWDNSNDPNGDSITYKVHIYYDGIKSGDAIDVGKATTYTVASVKSGASTIEFRIEAINSKGHSNIATISKALRTNKVPAISGTNTDIGIKNDEFSQTYTITDGDGEAVTVTEYIDNVKIRSYVAELGATNTFAVTGNTWLKLANGVHTLKITATDGIDVTTKTITFIKKVTILVVERAEPMPSDKQPRSIMVTVVKNIPEGAIFKVEACNNGYDASPTWEDITTRVLQGRIHDFTNTINTAGKWGVNVRVTVDRNGGEGACYITEIGGNFE